MTVVVPRQLTNAVLTALQHHCLQLRSLSVSKNCNMNDTAMVPMLQSCTQLHRLKLDECHGFTAAAILAMSLNCEGMQMLVRANNNHCVQSCGQVVPVRQLIGTCLSCRFADALLILC